MNRYDRNTVIVGILGLAFVWAIALWTVSGGRRLLAVGCLLVITAIEVRRWPWRR